MNPAFLVPAVLGVLAVIQAGLNRRVAAQWGLPTAVVLNGLVLTIGAVCLVLYFVVRPESGLNEIRFEVKLFAPWFLLPGLIGLGLVFGGPWSIAHLGAVTTFILLISSQLLMSVIWDLKVENLEISNGRWLGIALAWLGALLVCRS
jgi:uncharacterized membrane protein YdcZ (DUF606 family)